MGFLQNVIGFFSKKQDKVDDFEKNIITSGKDILEKLKARRTEFENLASLLGRKIEALEADIRCLEAKVGVQIGVKQKIEEKRSSIAKLNEEVAAFTQRIETLNKDILISEKVLIESKERVQNLDGDLKEAILKKEITKIRQDIAIGDAADLVSELESKINAENAQTEAIKTILPE